MGNVRCVQIRRNSSNVITRRRFFTPKKAVVNRQGDRGVDNATFILDPIQEISEGDEIYYLQDVTNLDSLVGIWNFHGSFRDESGFENDDFAAATYAFPLGSSIFTPTTGKYRGKHKMKVLADNGSNLGVRIPNLNDTASKPILDFSSNFDIFFEFEESSHGGSNTPVIFDKYDTITDTGIKISLNITGKTITTSMGNGTTTKVITTPLITSFDLTAPSLIRVSREGESITTWYNNVLEDTDTYASGGDLNTSKDLYLFTEYNDSTTAEGSQFDGLMCQLRIYNTHLTTVEAEKIWFAKPQTTTMKFGGKVWKIDDSGTSKKVVCNGFGNILLNTNITSNLLTGTTVFSNSSERVGNVFKPDPTNFSNQVTSDNIFNEIIPEIGLTNEYIWNLEETVSIQRGFVAEGLFIDLIRLLFKFTTEERQFNISPRKVIIVDNILETNNIITKSNFRLLDDGKDTTKVINEVIGVGRGHLKKHAQTSGLTTVSLSTTWSAEFMLKGLEFFEAFPTVIHSVTSDDGGGTTYTDANTESATGDRYIYDQGTNRIKFLKSAGSSTAAFTVTFSYRYEKSSATNLVQFSSNQASIDVNGKYSAKLNLPQLTAGVDVNTIVDNTITNLKDINRRVRAESSALINSISEGDQVRVFYVERGIGTQHPTTFVETPLIMTVKSIRYEYPNTLTTIELGEHAFDSFDLETGSVESIRQIASGSNENSL
jgi:hypothetical protein